MPRLQVLPGDPPRPGLPEVEPPPGHLPAGIEVREERLGVVKAQRVYQMRCECGRAWFELELPSLVQCPACAKLSAVSL